MTTTEIRDTEAPPANGETVNGTHAESKSVQRRKSVQREAPESLSSRAGMLLKEIDAFDTSRTEMVDAIDAEIARLQEMRNKLTGGKRRGRPAQPPTMAQAVAAIMAAPSPKPKPAKSPKPGPRGPRAESVPSRVMACLKEEPASAREIAFDLGIDLRVVHGALQNLAKAGKVKSKGERRNRVWSVK